MPTRHEFLPAWPVNADRDGYRTACSPRTGATAATAIAKELTPSTASVVGGIVFYTQETMLKYFKELRISYSCSYFRLPVRK